MARKLGFRQMLVGGGLASLAGALAAVGQGTALQMDLHPIMTGLLAVGIVHFFLGLFQVVQRPGDNTDA